MDKIQCVWYKYIRPWELSHVYEKGENERKVMEVNDQRDCAPFPSMCRQALAPSFDPHESWQ